jgi:hypothetical protein
MSTLILNKDVKTIALGLSVSKPTSLVAQTLTSLFTISGGRIAIVAFIGEATVANDATATTISYGYTPLGGSSAPAALAVASASLASIAIGQKLSLGATVAAQVVLSSVSAPVLFPPRLILNPGDITYTGAVGAGTLSLKYDLIYVPLDAGSQVVAD